MAGSSPSALRKETVTRALVGMAAWTTQLWNMLSGCKDWVAVKEFCLSYSVVETLLIIVYTHYGNLF